MSQVAKAFEVLKSAGFYKTCVIRECIFRARTERLPFGAPAIDDWSPRFLIRFTACQRTQLSSPAPRPRDWLGGNCSNSSKSSPQWSSNH
jgi:hypothetical protein